MKPRSVAAENGPRVGLLPPNRRLFHGLFPASGVRDKIRARCVCSKFLPVGGVHWLSWSGASIAGPVKSLMGGHVVRNFVIASIVLFAMAGTACNKEPKPSEAGKAPNEAGADGEAKRR